ncbi:hypothetical protein [Thermus altitudinis]|uniref:hypothetical protein n=1 Tax=Thermus altitudinis TaxID=2908145 RepID=UPI001FA9AA31|nr:hypothetical protein [Thermus altitudinis]
MKGFRIFWVLALMLTLPACSDVFLQQPYRVLLVPSQLGYEVDDQGKITVVGNNAYVQVAPGAPGGYLERYDYQVIDDSGNEVFAGSSLGSGFVGVEVPAGREESEGRVVYVSKQSQPFRFSLDGKVAAEHLQQGAPLNWRYLVTWYVTTSNGGVVRWVQEYQVKYPLK